MIIQWFKNRKAKKEFRQMLLQTTPEQWVEFGKQVCMVVAQNYLDNLFAGVDLQLRQGRQVGNSITKRYYLN